jgi:hypothetical protein
MDRAGLGSNDVTSQKVGWVASRAYLALPDCVSASGQANWFDQKKISCSWTWESKDKSCSRYSVISDATIDAHLVHFVILGVGSSLG